jgi:hypothetical protein
VLLDVPFEIHGKDFKTGELDYWDKEQTQPKKVVGINLALDSGEKVTLWANKPSSLFKAIAAAQRTAGKRIAVDGTLTVKYTGDEPNKNPNLDPARQFAAKYDPPGKQDPFAGTDEPPF